MGMLDGYWVRLSVRGPNGKYLGTDEIWEKAESALKRVSDKEKLPYKIGVDEAAFYGPKLDFMFKDAINREWQLSTIQCDFNLPERFDLSFINEKGEKERPVVIHRAISGSIERFMGVMIEHFAGAFPPWLSPTQATIIPITDDQHDFAKKVYLQMIAQGIRVDIDDRSEKMQAKIRDAQLQKIPYMLVIGQREVDSDSVSVRQRDGQDLGAISVVDFIAKIKEQISNKSLNLIK
jgi:threonyl-tRNA synthetase